MGGQPMCCRHRRRRGATRRLPTPYGPLTDKNDACTREVRAYRKARAQEEADSPLRSGGIGIRSSSEAGSRYWRVRCRRLRAGSRRSGYTVAGAAISSPDSSA